MSYKTFRERLEKVKAKLNLEDENPYVKQTSQEPDPAIKVSEKLKSLFRSKTEMDVNEHTEKLQKMSKTELDEYAEQYGIHLDRRYGKKHMIEEFLTKLKGES